MDNISPQKRSWTMAQVKSSRNQSTEMALIRVMRKHGITGWRRKYPLPGKPDFVFPRAKLAVFVDGCFWHGHPSKCRLPNTNHDYWAHKIEKNVARDRIVTRLLRKKGWQVMRIWENETEHDKTVNKLQAALS